MKRNNLPTVKITDGPSGGTSAVSTAIHTTSAGNGFGDWLDSLSRNFHIALIILGVITIPLMIGLCCWVWRGMKRIKKKLKKKLGGGHDDDFLKNYDHEQIVLPEASPDLEPSPVQPYIDENMEEQEFGKLNFTLCYDDKRTELRIHLIQASDLPIKDIGSTFYTYTEIELMPLHKMAQFPIQSELVRDSLSPIFNQIFTFSYLSKEELNEQKLYMHVYNYNRISKRDGIGTVQIKLHDVWGLTMGKECSFWEKIKWLKKDEGEVHGDLSLGLRYLPLSQQLSVLVKEIVRLKPHHDGLTNPYVQVQILQDDHVIMKQKTGVRNSTLNPVYHQAFYFSIPTTKIRKIDLQLTIKHHVSMRNKHYLGKVFIGPNSHGNGAKHWNDMMRSDQYVSMWHHVFKEIDNSPDKIFLRDRRGAIAGSEKRR